MNVRPAGPGGAFFTGDHRAAIVTTPRPTVRTGVAPLGRGRLTRHDPGGIRLGSRRAPSPERHEGSPEDPVPTGSRSGASRMIGLCVALPNAGE